MEEFEPSEEMQRWIDKRYERKRGWCWVVVAVIVLLAISGGEEDCEFEVSLLTDDTSTATERSE